MQDSFNHLNKSPCGVKYERDLAHDSGNDAYMIVNGNLKVYNRAFEKQNERQMYDDIANDGHVMSRAPLPKNLKNRSFKNALN